MEMLKVTDKKLEILKNALSLAVMEFDANAGEEGTNNSGPYIRKYLNGLAEPPMNWCAAFVCWCIKEACENLNISMPFEYTLSARKLHNIFKANGWAWKDIQEQEPQAGDIVFFWRGDNEFSWMGHVGFVLDRYDSEVSPGSWKKVLQTIEGNKGYFPAHVNKYRYDATNVPQLLGYGRIK